MKTYSTEQEEFWAGEFGKEYIQRNNSEEYLASNIHFFSKALKYIERPKSLIEFGANIGMNLKAIKMLFPDIHLNGIEINKEAAEELGKVIESSNVFNESIINFIPPTKYDIVLIKGVLIHINPDFLNEVYRNLYNATNKYLLVCEYYNPTPVVINYRGHSNRLFKRDFAGELMDQYKELMLIDYGFAYHKDNCFPQDDITWFLLEKKS